MTIHAIVEGHGEVAAVPELLRRLRNEAGAYGIRVGRAIRRNRSDLVIEAPLRRAVRLALMQPDCSAILVLFDSHQDCPKLLAPTVEGWARAEAGATPCAVVMAHREYEAWFLASIESLRGKRGVRVDAEPHARPEDPGGAKAALAKRMERSCVYSERLDQPRLTAIFDLGAAYGTCRSFRRMAKAFGTLASGMGIPLHEWPPAAWLKEQHSP